MTLRKVIVFIFIFVLFYGISGDKALADFDCVKDLNNNSSLQQKQICINELSQIEAQLNDLLNKQKEQQKHTGTLKTDVDYLSSKINALNTKIKARTLAVAVLKVSINEKSAKINTLSQKIQGEKQSLAQLLRNTNEFDNQNLVYLLLSDTTLSEFYSDLESYSSIKEAVKVSVENITGIKIQTEEQKKDLEKQQDAETDAKVELQSTQQQVTKSQDEKKQLLTISKKKESDYQKVILERQKRVTDIKARLFQLAGGSKAINFESALQYAETISAQTRIDPAFLLAILTQESNLGSNVGKCYLTNSTTGAGVNVDTGKTWWNLMHAKRDVPIFLSVTASLGLNAFKTVVSCPIASAGGYGGAMGPAQFIPSTWNEYSSKVSQITGSNPANPWSPIDAFTASALYLTSPLLGGSGTSSSAQQRAACKYYGSGGASCGYSRSVMALKSKIQADIDYLKQYGVSKR